MTEEQIATVLEAIRKQGRASIAAQAAAESCLEAVRKLNGANEAPAANDAANLLHALLPALDALQRVASEAAAVDDAPRGFLARWIAPQRAGRIEALVQGVRLLGAQFENALRMAGVTIDDEVGVTVDGARHRVVSMRREHARVGQVLEVVRAGYQLDGRVVREAEVIAGGQD